jgi:hypothetical protein
MEMLATLMSKMGKEWSSAVQNDLQ